MALRSLAGKLRGLLSRRTAASRDAAPDPDVIWPPLKFEGSVEAHAEALKKRIIKQARLDNLEFQRGIRKDYRDAVIFAAGGIGIGTYFWSRAIKALVDA
ncbi:hypothetical protein EJB05_14682 [Eragrostis curvula]|uniref:Uncharacterized protein n=1 Tax=Eragrostis curvula TaxID=38414 RepID=A0A5J9VZR5_9POAL|nr:hypothetical protein EJB05_14682 [Eragrostis curvula]